jgi:hypothetical protein
MKEAVCGQVGGEEHGELPDTVFVWHAHCHLFWRVEEGGGEEGEEEGKKEKKGGEDQGKPLTWVVLGKSPALRFIGEPVFEHHNHLFFFVPVQKNNRTLEIFADDEVRVSFCLSTWGFGDWSLRGVR